MLSCSVMNVRAVRYTSKDRETGRLGQARGLRPEGGGIHYIIPGCSFNAISLGHSPL
ncbi:hypothetical protein J6590_080967 [Homalodisca vitripennis]|nr:hypothetical protein J6590_080967 [Homalodisca vitripennis]